MKKVQIILFITFLLFGLDSKAQEKKINNSLSINIPNNYKYLELSVSQLVTNFPVLFPNEQIRNGLGIGMKSKIIFISNSYKTINFFRDITSPLGLKKFNKNHMEPFLIKLKDQEFQNKLINIMRKTNPAKNFENLTPAEVNLLMKDLYDNPQFMREMKILIEPFISKFENEYNLEKVSILLVGDEKANILNNLNKQDIADLEKNFKKTLKEISQKNIDPAIKNLENWKFKISKNNNNNLYLYSNDSFYNDLFYSDFKQEILLTSHNNKIFLLISFCHKSCNDGTDFSNIIRTTNLYSANYINNKVVNDDFVNQLKDLNNLYKSGALSKEEFEKAKKKLLN